MNIEAMLLYNKKNILRRATSEEFANFKNKHVLQKEKTCAWEIDSSVIKRYLMCQGKGSVLKRK